MDDITDMEKKAGMVARDKRMLPKTKDLGEFMQYVDEHRGNFVGVMFTDRVAFLEANDYEVTRANLIDGELSAQPPKEEKAPRKRGFLRRR